MKMIRETLKSPTVAQVVELAAKYPDAALEADASYGDPAEVFITYTREKTPQELKESEESEERYNQNDLVTAALNLEKIRKECPDLWPEDIRPIALSALTGTHHMQVAEQFRRNVPFFLACYRKDYPEWFKS